jgi:hypothetical protein
MSNKKPVLGKPVVEMDSQQQVTKNKANKG